MRQELKDVYKKFFFNYVTMPRDIIQPLYFERNIVQEYNVIRIIQQELERVRDLYLNEVEIRSDANLFVLIIYHQMVALPLIIEKRDINIDSLEENIRMDIKNLFKSAYELKRYENEKEISAHTILSLLNSQWSKLNIAKNEWWNS